MAAATATRRTPLLVGATTGVTAGAVFTDPAAASLPEPGLASASSVLPATEIPVELSAASDTPVTVGRTDSGHRALSGTTALLAALVGAALLGGLWLGSYRARLRYH